MVPVFVEINLVRHQDGHTPGEHCFTLTATDNAMGWIVNRNVRDKDKKWVFEALEHVTGVIPFPIIGTDSRECCEFIDDRLRRYCTERKITFSRSRSGNSYDGTYVEQKEWAHAGELVGHYRYDIAASLATRIDIWQFDRVFTNYYLPQQRLIFKQRVRAKVTKKPDAATIPHHACPRRPGRAEAWP